MQFFFLFIKNFIGVRDGSEVETTYCSSKGTYLVPSTYVRWFIATYNSNCGGSKALFCSLHCTHVHIPNYTYT